jgi:predicted DNA-binding transcriptional regulator AlpA
MPLHIDGTHYYLATEIAQAVGVSRVTLWRWIKDGKVPAGHKFRGKKLIFTRGEAEAIREYALRVEPAFPTARDQLPLFGRSTG